MCKEIIPYATFLKSRDKNTVLSKAIFIDVYVTNEGSSFFLKSTKPAFLWLMCVHSPNCNCQIILHSQPLPGYGK